MGQINPVAGELSETRKGREVKILGVIPKGEFPIIGHFVDQEIPRAWRTSGQYFLDFEAIGDLDLIRRVEPCELKELRVYVDSDIIRAREYEHADYDLSIGPRIATIYLAMRDGVVLPERSRIEAAP